MGCLELSIFLNANAKDCLWGPFFFLCTVANRYIYSVRNRKGYYKRFVGLGNTTQQCGNCYEFHFVVNFREKISREKYFLHFYRQRTFLERTIRMSFWFFFSFAPKLWIRSWNPVSFKNMVWKLKCNFATLKYAK